MSTAENLPETPLASRRDEFDFLSPERRQKFDLLVHLLVNLDQPLFISGPDGIGKTTLLNQLQLRSLDGWRICMIEGSEELSFEAIQQKLARSLGMESGNEPELRARLDFLGGHEEIAVVVVEDAGRLIPGVLDALCRFALRYPALRVVAALRPDDIHVKGSTDPWAVEEAHIIEMPPLTEAQSQAFLRNLWLHLGKTVEPEGKEAAEIYRLSHGIPANIRRYALDRLAKEPVQWQWAMAKPVYGSLAAALLVVVGIMLWQQQTSETEANPAPVPPVTEPGNNKVGPVTAPENRVKSLEPAPLARLPSLDSSDGSRLDSKVRAVEEKNIHAEQEPSSEPVLSSAPLVSRGQSEPQALKATAKAQVVEQEASAAAEQAMVVSAEDHSTEPTSSSKLEPVPQRLPETLQDASWLLEQPPLSYTLQIAAFDKLTDLQAFARKYSRLQPLAFYRKKRKGKDWYPLLYGVFSSLNDANHARKQLPAGLKQPWLRRLRSVQKEIRQSSSP